MNVSHSLGDNPQVDNKRLPLKKWPAYFGIFYRDPLQS